MKITLEYVAQVSSELLNVLNKEKVETTADLEKMVGREIVITSVGDSIEFLKRLSDSETKAYIVSYSKRWYGFPIELKINPTLNYSLVILMAETIIEGYKELSIDAYDNIRQCKKFESSDFRFVKEELEKLSLPKA